MVEGWTAGRVEGKGCGDAGGHSGRAGAGWGATRTAGRAGSKRSAPGATAAGTTAGAGARRSAATNAEHTPARRPRPVGGVTPAMATQRCT